MSFEYRAVPHTFQHDTRAILAQHPRRLSVGQLMSLEELGVAPKLSTGDYRHLLSRVAHGQSNRRERREMVSKNAKTVTDNFELRRLAQIEAKSRAGTSRAGQRPSFVTKAQEVGAV